MMSSYVGDDVIDGCDEWNSSQGFSRDLVEVAAAERCARSCETPRSSWCKKSLMRKCAKKKNYFTTMKTPKPINLVTTRVYENACISHHHKPPLVAIRQLVDKLFLASLSTTYKGCDFCRDGPHLSTPWPLNSDHVSVSVLANHVMPCRCHMNGKR